MNYIFVEEFGKDSVGFEVLLTSHCNLKCRGCMRYSNIAKQEFYSFEDIKKDFANFKRIRHDRMYFCLTGGEPLLHPQFIDIAEWLHSEFPQCDIVMCTNGLLFTRQSEEWYRRLSKCISIVHYTRYNTNKVDYDRIIEICEKYGVKHNNVLGTDTGHVLDSIKDYFPRDRLQELTEIIKEAQTRNPPVRNKFYLDLLSEPSENAEDIDFKKIIKCRADCLCIWDGKIWQCSRCCKSYILNDKFKTNFEISKEDYLDLYELKSRDQIFKFWSKPIPFCRYCHNKYTDPVEWEQYKYTKEDFVG